MPAGYPLTYGKNELRYILLTHSQVVFYDTFGDIDIIDFGFVIGRKNTMDMSSNYIELEKNYSFLADL